MALQPLCWTLASFSSVIIFTQTVGLLGRGISPSQDCCVHTEQQKRKINAYTDIHDLSGIRTHNPSVQASEHSSGAGTVIGRYSKWSTVF
jgi:hypothetical protein